MPQPSSPIPGGQPVSTPIPAPSGKPAPSGRRATRPARPGRGAKAVAGSVARWGATGLLCAGALVLAGAAGTVSADHQDRLAELAEPATAARERMAAAQVGLELVPTAETARGWLLAATTASGTVADVQNTLLANTGPLDLSAVPLETLTPQGTVVVYTEDERTAMAEAARAERISGLDRQLLSFFADVDTDSSGLNAASNWTASLPGVSADPAAPTMTWSSPEVSWFDQDNTSTVVWELRDASGALRAWASATATFDQTNVKLTGLVLDEAAPSEVAP